MLAISQILMFCINLRFKANSDNLGFNFQDFWSNWYLTCFWRKGAHPKKYPDFFLLFYIKPNFLNLKVKSQNLGIKLMPSMTDIMADASSLGDSLAYFHHSHSCISIQLLILNFGYFFIGPKFLINFVYFGGPRCDKDTNRTPADDANRTIPGNLAIQVAPSGGQIGQLC